jgi:hypothetical protein
MRITAANRLSWPVLALTGAWMSMTASGKQLELVTTACQKECDSQTPCIGKGFASASRRWLSFRQGRKADAATRTPFAAFSGTPLAAIGEQGAKAAQMSTGGQNSQRPIIVLKLVG